MDTASHRHPMVQICHCTPRKQQKLHRARLNASAQNLEQLKQFSVGSTDFLLQATPTVGQLLEYMVSSNNHPCATAIGNLVEMVHIQQAEQLTVHNKYTTIRAGRTYGQLQHKKSDNVIWMMYENFSSLSLFTEGSKKHVKMHQLNKLMADYSVDVLAGCKTRTNWRFITDEDSRFPNFFGNGQPSQGVYAYNINTIK
jgi:hypothetical protein